MLKDGLLIELSVLPEGFEYCMRAFNQGNEAGK